MADRLLLSYWLPEPAAHAPVAAWEKMLRLFPYSRLSRWPSTLRIYAVGYDEPLLREQAFPSPLDIDAVMAVARESAAEDCAASLDAYWDLWQLETDEGAAAGGEWRVRPVRATMSCFGPAFESEWEDQVRLEFGLESHFLLPPEWPGAAAMIQENIKSLLHLVRDMDQMLGAGRRRLWTDSGADFAERLQAQM